MSRKFARFVGSAVCLLVLAAARRPVAAVCVGDCDTNGTVAIREVQACINIFLGAPLSNCPNCDQNGDHSVGIGEVRAAVSSFLDASGCPQVSPAAGATPTTTPVIAPTNTPSVAPTATATTAPTNTAPPTNTGAPTATNTLPGNTATSAPTNTPTSTPSPTPTNTLAPTATKTLSVNTATFTATRTRTPTRPPATPTGTATSATPALGVRAFSLGPASGFFSSLAPFTSAVGQPTGTLLLSAGPPNASGQATVTLTGGPTVIRTDLSLGGLTLCTRVESCTGTLYCNGGTNVDILNSLDSLKQGLTCTQTGTVGQKTDCPPPPTPAPPHGSTPAVPTRTPFPCCSNGCEGGSALGGVCTGSPPTPTPGGPIVNTPTPCVNSGNSPKSMVGVNATDSGSGAMVLTCMQRSATVMPIGDCSTADFTSASLSPQDYTTGTDIAQVINFCVGSGAIDNKIPAFAKKGTNFNCAQWPTPNAPGVLAFTIPSEQGSTSITGDGANAGLWSGIPATPTATPVH